MHELSIANSIVTTVLREIATRNLPPVNKIVVRVGAQAHPLGRESVVIGDVVPDNPGLVTMQTRIGGWRIVDMLVAEQLPRIC
jgi:hydrogenase expression/formation protein HypE